MTNVTRTPLRRQRVLDDIVINPTKVKVGDDLAWFIALRWNGQILDRRLASQISQSEIALLLAVYEKSKEIAASPEFEILVNKVNLKGLLRTESAN
jgi:hypothetical protein